MTVIEFGKRELRINFAISLLVGLIVISMTWGIFLYNQLIGLRHDIAKGEQMLDNIQVRNAELKNSLYEILDGTSPESFLESNGLVVEKNPQYSKVSNSVSQASR